MSMLRVLQQTMLQLLGNIPTVSLRHIYRTVHSIKNRLVYSCQDCNINWIANYFTGHSMEQSALVLHNSLLINIYVWQRKNMVSD